MTSEHNNDARDPQPGTREFEDRAERFTWGPGDLRLVELPDGTKVDDKL